MNKKIVRKLALSAVTLGVAALSVTTTTFAWFTTNSSATASAVSATVETSDANLMIRSYDADNSAWDPWETEATLHAPSGTSLSPVSITNSSAYAFGTFYSMSNSDQSFSVADSTAVLCYKIQYAVTDIPTGTTNLKLYFTNFTFSTDSTKASQYLLVNAASDVTTNTGAAAGQTLSLGLDQVLNMQINTVYSDATGADLSDQSTGSGASFTCSNYRYDNATDAVDSTGADAVVYYNNIYGTSLSRPSGNYNTNYASTAMVTASTADSAITLATFDGSSTQVYATSYIYFFIDGWDYQCFNAIGGTSITAGTLNFKISSAA